MYRTCISSVASLATAAATAIAHLETDWERVRRPPWFHSCPLVQPRATQAILGWTWKPLDTNQHIVPLTKIVPLTTMLLGYNTWPQCLATVLGSEMPTMSALKGICFKQHSVSSNIALYGSLLDLWIKKEMEKKMVQCIPLMLLPFLPSGSTHSDGILW